MTSWTEQKLDQVGRRFVFRSSEYNKFNLFIDKQVVAWCDSVEIEIDFCGFEFVIGSFAAGVRGDH